VHSQFHSRILFGFAEIEGAGAVRLAQFVSSAEEAGTLPTPLGRRIGKKCFYLEAHGGRGVAGVRRISRDLPARKFLAPAS
jgi:hypothetical protein